jgi:hypothetical protein
MHVKNIIIHTFTEKIVDITAACDILKYMYVEKNKIPTFTLRK